LILIFPEVIMGSECVFCKSITVNPRKFLELDLCERCFFERGFDECVDQIPPDDRFLKKYVDEANRFFVDALALYASLQPKPLATEILAFCLICVHNGDLPKENFMEFFIAARAVHKFGYDTDISPVGMVEKTVETLECLGSGVKLAIIMNGVNRSGYGKMDPNDPGTIEKMKKITEKQFRSMLDDISKSDDGTLQPYIDVMERRSVRGSI
jgi:hypothetical protein